MMNEFGTLKDADGKTVSVGDRVKVKWESWIENGVRQHRTRDHDVVMRESSRGSWYMGISDCMNYLGGMTFWKIEP